MEKERIENALRCEISQDDMKYIRTYYLRFYNAPEDGDQAILNLIRMDLNKQVDPNYITKLTAADKKFIKAVDWEERQVKSNTYVEAPNEIPHFGRYTSFRDGLWLTFEWHERFCVATNISKVDIDWLITIVKNILEQHGDKFNIMQANRMKSYWVEAANAYIQLGLDKDFTAYRDCMLEMFSRYDNGADAWNLNDELRWKTRLYRRYYRLVKYQVLNSPGMFAMDKTFEYTVEEHTCEQEEYVGALEVGINQTIRMLEDYRRERQLSGEAVYDYKVDGQRVLDLIKDSFAQEVQHSIHYDWRAMLAAREEGKTLTLEDIKDIAINKIIEEIENTIEPCDVDTAIRDMEEVYGELERWVQSRPWEKYARGSSRWPIDYILEYTTYPLHNCYMHSEFFWGANMIIRQCYSKWDWGNYQEYLDKVKVLLDKVKAECESYRGNVKAEKKPEGSVSRLLAKIAEES